jgi:PAS domain S-box-containing protein
VISGVDKAITVLIVEDDLVDRKALERALIQSSLDIARIWQAASLAEAIEWLEKEEPDIVLLDLGLPDGHGLESVSRLQKWMDEIPIVVLSGLEDEQTAVSAVQKGVQDYLTKDSINGSVLSRVICYAIERKEHERQLRTAEERYRTIFQNSAVAIMMADETDRLISWNQLTEDLLGMDSSDLHLREVKSLYPEDQWQKIRNEHVKRKGMQHHLETQMIRKTGEIIDVDISLTVLTNTRGEATGTIGVVGDITERKEAETRLKQAKEQAEQMSRELLEATTRANEMAARAEAANAAKSQFLANMTHEIRTPMNAIIGFSDILAEQELSSEQKGHVDLIRDSGRHLLGLINDILDLSKIEAGRFQIELRNCELAAVLDSVEAMMRTLAERKGLEFKVIKSPDVPDLMNTDSSRLRQCLVNLISNAIKFTQAGHVHVRVFLDGERSDPCLRLDVEDTGIGIPFEKQEAVFEAFAQADGTTTRKYGGTGLGLTITKKLIGLLGGTVFLRSQPGQGSVFSLTMPAGFCPLDRPSAPDSSTLEPVAEKTHRMQDAQFCGRVLVAEDVQTNQILIKLLLERMGLDVTVVENGHEVVKEATENSYDLILMDVQMPRMNGHEATRQLRCLGLRTPIVALTAHTMKEDRQECLAAGCDDYLTKPIDRDKLADALARYLPFAGDGATKRPIPSVGSAPPPMSDHSDSAVPAGVAETPTIAWGQLISRIGDEDLVRELMPICVADNRSRLESLSEAVAANDAANVKLYAHAIKGSAANLGAEQFSEAARHLEHMAASDDLSGAQAHVEAIRAAFERLEDFVSQPDWVEQAKRQDMAEYVG